MTDYTVLLLYPDYAASNYGEETYLTHVTADNVPAAQAMAQMEAMISNELDPEEYDPKDFAVLAVFAGHLQDICIQN